jgi:hypothetical protein
MTMTRPCMIGMAVRKNGTIDWAPGINKEIALRAVKPLGAAYNKR